jgi:hypothetical protein
MSEFKKPNMSLKTYKSEDLPQLTHLNNERLFHIIMLLYIVIGAIGILTFIMLA